MAPVLEEVASELKGLVSVARVDVMSNRDVGTRFGISGFPTLKLFSQGHIYTFTGRRSVEEIVEFGGPPRDAELVGEGGHLARVEVADGDDFELVGIGEVALGDVRAADAGADDGDCVDSCHCAHTVPRSAICCAVSASSIAL